VLRKKQAQRCFLLKSLGIEPTKKGR